MGIGSAIKRLASNAERIAHTEVRGTDKVKGAVRRGKAFVERERIKRAAKKVAKDEQKYQDFEREHLSDEAKARKQARKSKEELEDVKEELRELERSKRRRSGKGSFNMFGGSGRQSSSARRSGKKNDLSWLVGPEPKESSDRSEKGRKLGADYSFGNILNTGSRDTKKKRKNGYGLDNVLDI